MAVDVWWRGKGWSPDRAPTGYSNRAGQPWIWREGVDDYPRGLAGQSSDLGLEVSYWTYMVDATGTTCMSVDAYEFGSGRVGGFTDTDMPTYSDGWATQLGNYTAGCFS